MKWLARLKIQKGEPTHPTEPTKPGFVGFAGSIPAPVKKTGEELTASNDGDPDPDRWCYPNSGAMNTREIDTFTARLARFTDRGLSLTDGELLADRLVQRDREQDDRRVCLECTHLQRDSCYGNRQEAGITIQSPDAKLPSEIVVQLKGCDGFSRSIRTRA